MGFQVKHEDYCIGGVNFHIQSLRDKQQYYDPDGVSERAGVSSANWSLFGVVWPSSELLAKLMSAHNIEGLRILEVGCGLALASLVLQQRGADITACDYHPMVPSFLSTNTAINKLHAIQMVEGDWAKDTGVVDLYDLIIGSDILYERGHFDILSQFILRHAQANAKVVIIDPGRGYAGKFSKRMKSLGFDCIEARETMTLADKNIFSARVMTYQRHAIHDRILAQ
jgi:predicted nicotinamide N-methyase